MVADTAAPTKLLRCGSVMTEGFQVPMVAWTLGVHTLAVRRRRPRDAAAGPAPNVILQTRAYARPRPAARSSTLAAHVHYRYVGRSGPMFRLFFGSG